MEELCTSKGEEFYLELIAKELNGDISEAEKSVLYQWVTKLKDNRSIFSSPLLCLYLGFVN